MGIRALGLTGVAVALFGCGDGDRRAGLHTLLPGLDERPSNATCIAPARESRYRAHFPT